MNQAVFPHITPAHTRCIQCLQVMEVSAQACPHCGHPEQHYYPHPLYLSPHTLLQGQYLLGGVLGQGGFGITYIGLDLKLNKRVAIKEYLPSSLALRDPTTHQVMPLHNQAAALQKGLDSFIQEARNLAKFNHPNIVRVLNYFEENQTAYMVMDYLQGDNPARRLCDGGGKLSLDEALKIVLPILDALDVIHAQQVFHLDVSAHNILLTHNDVPVLIDFGAARSVSVIVEYTRSMTLVLKPGYSPLEQYSDQGNIGPWTDIYACAALLYLLLHGQLPPAATERWQQDSLQIQLLNQADERVPSVERALKKALAVNPQQRWQSVAEFRAALLASPRSPVMRPAFGYALAASLVLGGLGTFWLTEDLPETVLSSQQDNSAPLPPVATLEAASKLEAEEPTLNRAEWLKATQSYWLSYAQQQAQAQQFDAASQTYQAVLHLQPEQPEALQGLAHLVDQRLAQERALAEQQRQAQVRQLLAQAERQLQAQKLTQPSGDNAYASYQALLAIAPEQALVQQLPKRIADSYAQLANNTQDWQKRANFIEKGLAILPQHADLLALQQNLQQEPVAANAIVEAAGTAPQTSVAFAEPEPPQAVQSQAQQSSATEQPFEQQAAQIAQWLQTAQQALAQNNLDIAQKNYQKVLALQAQHPDAQKGLQTIAARYTDLALQQKKQGEWVESLVLVGKGLGVQAQYPALLQLQQELRDKLKQTNPTEAAAEKNAATQQKPLLLTPSF